MLLGGGIALMSLLLAVGLALLLARGCEEGGGGGGRGGGRGAGTGGVVGAGDADLDAPGSDGASVPRAAGSGGPEQVAADEPAEELPAEPEGSAAPTPGREEAGAGEIEEGPPGGGEPGEGGVAPEEAPEMVFYDHDAATGGAGAPGDVGGVGRFRGIYQGRGAGQRGRLLKAGGGTPQVSEAVERGLAWLARVQEEDGHWDARRWGGPADTTSCGSTGLALLAFLGAGYTHHQGKYNQTVGKAFDWLAGVQQQNGHFSTGRFYEQAICTMALCEAYAMTRDDRLRGPAQRGVNRIIEEQPEDGGFDYTGNTGRVDTSVTGWNIMAIKSAVIAQLSVPDEALRRCRNFVEFATLPDGGMGYSGAHGRPPAPASDSMTAVGAVCRHFLDCPRDDPMLVGACDRVVRSGPLMVNYYYTYYGTLALFLMGPNSKYWTEWNARFRDPMIALQAKEGDLAGSWPTLSTYGRSGGRVYTTAMAIMSLEVYWRFLPAYAAAGG